MRMLSEDFEAAFWTLNDGLKSNHLWLWIRQLQNITFHEYLTQLDVNLLEEIATSNLIQKPKLEEDTEKFQDYEGHFGKESRRNLLIGRIRLKWLFNYRKLWVWKPSPNSDKKNELVTGRHWWTLYKTKYCYRSSTHDQIILGLGFQANRHSSVNTGDFVSSKRKTVLIVSGKRVRKPKLLCATDVLQENIIEMFLENISEY